LEENLFNKFKGDTVEVRAEEESSGEGEGAEGSG